jgi:hypothetical protein
MPRPLRLSLVLLVLAASPVQAQQVERIDIVEWGIYQHDVRGEIPAPEAPAGKRNVIDNVRLQQATTTVPALVGMKFGYRFRVVGSSPGALVRLEYVVRFPKQGLTNPAKAKTFATSQYHSHAAVGEVAYRGYSFDYDWEVETGPWHLEIWHEGRKLAEKIFMVTRLVSSAE